MTKQEVIEAAQKLREYCSYVPGEPCSKDCCFLRFDCDGGGVCSLWIDFPYDWKLTEVQHDD